MIANTTIKRYKLIQIKNNYYLVDMDAQMFRCFFLILFGLVHSTLLKLIKILLNLLKQKNRKDQ